MSLDDYERFMKVENQKDFTKVLRQQIPEFIQMGRDLATATERAAKLDHEGRLASPKDMSVDSYCVQCALMLKLPENVQQFQCPNCGALQDMAGELLVQVEQEGLRTAEEAVPETPAVEIVEGTVLRPSDKDREWHPEPAREEATSPSQSETATPLVAAASNA